MSFGSSTRSLLHHFLQTRSPEINVAEITAPYQHNTSSLPRRLSDVFWRTFDLGFTAFGGPPVHFQIFHHRFVDGRGKTPWIDEQTVSTPDNNPYTLVLQALNRFNRL